MNRRHKTILFVTLLATGSALLAGIELKTALGMLILGVAFAWAAGSEVARSAYRRAKGITSAFYLWARLPIVMAFAGTVLGVVLVLSRGNPVAAIGIMSLLGIFLEPLVHLPKRKEWLRIPVILSSPVGFVLMAYSAMLLDQASLNDHAEKLAQMTLTSLVALLFGIWWLSKGWKLIQKGLGTEPDTSTVVEALQNGTIGAHVSLVFGIVILTLWVGLLTWSASSNWSYDPWQFTPSKNDNTLLASWGQAAFILLLGWWPYAMWRRILALEPNSEPIYLRRHKRITTVVGTVFAVVFCIAVTFGIQNGSDRILTRDFEASNAALKELMTKVGGIKQRKLETTQDYIDAYAELEPLIADLDAKIARAEELYQKAKHQDESRGPVNIQRFYHNDPQNWKSYVTVMDFLRQSSELTKQEMAAARDMAALPQQDQPRFWNAQFRPLIEQEDVLRQKAIDLQQAAAKGTKAN